MALLTVDMRGFTYHAHFQRAPNTRGPDFIVQNGATRAFVEAKGAFVAPQQLPNIKAVLRDGLEQLNKCKKRGVTKSFVIATFLREVGDKSSEPSLVALVDPDINDNGPDDKPDWVIRENYAGWLRAMGLNDVASDLRGRITRERGEPILMWRKSLAGSEFLLMPIDWPFLRFDELDFWPWPWWPLRDARCVVIGLRRAVIDGLQPALRNPSSSLIELFNPDTEQGFVSGPVEDEGFYGSVMSDGSLMGTISVDSLLGSVQPEEIEL